MSTNIKSKKRNSATARPIPRSDRTSETEFVAQEAADAKSALLESVAKLKTSAANSLDIRQWARRYPLRTAGAAVLAGFVAAAWAKGRRASEAKSCDAEPVGPDANRSQAAASERATGESSSRNALSALIITALLDVLKTAAQTFLMNALRPTQDDSSPEADEDEVSSNQQ
jgi:hypothetical protein